MADGEFGAVDGEYRRYQALRMGKNEEGDDGCN
jgi:hypothetical protein